MTFKVVLKEGLELLLLLDVGARGDQGTASQLLVKLGILSPVQLINGQLPDAGPGLLGTRAMTRVRDPAEGFLYLLTTKIMMCAPVIQSVRPDWHLGEWDSYAGVIGEVGVVHHPENVTVSTF